MTEAIIAQVGQLLEQHLSHSKAKQTPALNQQAPETIAQELLLKERLKDGFQGEDDLLAFVKTYLTHTNHLSHPHYMGHQVAVPHDFITL